ncbi:MAG: alpha/beta hydrolase [Planctomycetota bacterium]
MTRFLVLATIFFAPACLPGLRPACAADGPKPQTFDSNGAKICYVVEGEGPPVVLIHGLHASAAINWGLPSIIEMLARDHRVIALDLRGHGGSDKPDKEDAYGTEMVEDVVRLMDHLGVKKAHIVGYSLGGMITVKLMTLHPERVLSGTVCGMGWFREGSALQKIWERGPLREGSRTPAECIRSIGKLAVTEEEIKGIRVPVVVLVGDRDPVKPLYVAPLQQVRPDWPVIEIQDAGHLNCIMKTQFKEEIRKSLARHVQP